MVQNHNCFHSRGIYKTAKTPKMGLFMTLVNGFSKLRNFVKPSILDVGGSPRCTSMWWLSVKKSSILDPGSNISLYYRCNDPLFQNGYALYKVFLFKVPKHKETWSKSSILVVEVVLDLRSFKLVWGKGRKETAPSIPSKRFTEDINCQKVLQAQTFHEAVFHSPTFVTCFVDFLMRTYSFLSSQVSWISFWQKLLDCIKATSINMLD